MKKLLLLLLCVPLIYSCQQNNPNPNNFLETQDGTVWNRINFDMENSFERIGFYNSSYFFINKDTSSHSCSGIVLCERWSEGNMVLNGPVVTTITKHTSTELSFSVANPGQQPIIIYNFTLDGNNFLKLDAELFVNNNGNQLSNSIMIDGLFERSSTETNLSCN